MDAAWGDDALPETACVSGFSGPKAQEYAGLLFCLGVFWVFGFGYLDFSDGRLDLRVAVGMGFGAVLLLWLGALWLRARRASAHEHLAGLIWLPVRRSYPIRSDGIASEVRVYELDLPAGAKPSRLTVHSSALHGRFVFRDASRSEVLAARLFQSNQVLVLSSSLREIREDPLAPLSHPRHRLVKLA